MNLNANFLSKLGHRGTFSMALMEVAKEDPNLAVLTADLGVLTGLSRFKNAYPNMFYNVGIAEQNMIGIASGLAKEGFNCFATTYANFITMRSFEQIRMNLGLMKLNVKVVGTGGGVCMAMSGNSHYGLEDIAIMRALPNMTIVCPCDGMEILKTIKAASKFNGPMYIRLTGNLNAPIVYNDDFDFEIGKAIELENGQDVALIAHGTMVDVCLKASKILKGMGINCSVIDMHTIKPLDTNMIDNMLSRKLIVTVEEHSIIGGLGGSVAEYLAPLSQKPKHIILGINDEYPKPAEYEFLLDKFGLTPEKISEKIQKELRM